MGRDLKKQQTKTTTCKPHNFLHTVTDMTDKNWKYSPLFPGADQ